MQRRGGRPPPQGGSTEWSQSNGLDFPCPIGQHPLDSDEWNRRTSDPEARPVQMATPIQTDLFGPGQPDQPAVKPSRSRMPQVLLLVLAALLLFGGAAFWLGDAPEAAHLEPTNREEQLDPLHAEIPSDDPEEGPLIDGFVSKVGRTARLVYPWVAGRLPAAR